MSNFQNPYQKIAWLERRLNALDSLVRKWISPSGLVNGGNTGTTTVGVLDLHSHSGDGDGGKITYLRFVEGAAPATPPSGHVHLYAKSDGRMYSKDDAGTESGPL
jgi:hypothetical protein